MRSCVFGFFIKIANTRTGKFVYNKTVPVSQDSVEIKKLNKFTKYYVDVQALRFPVMKNSSCVEVTTAEDGELYFFEIAAKMMMVEGIGLGMVIQMGKRWEMEWGSRR